METVSGRSKMLLAAQTGLGMQTTPLCDLYGNRFISSTARGAKGTLEIAAKPCM